MADQSHSTIPGSCPYPDELGQAGWTILHTAAAVYPNHPTKEQQEGMRKFIEGWSWPYACSHCAYHMRQSLIRHPPVVTNKREASTYICTLHNKVNKLLDKEEYDCSPDNVLRRWHPSYPEMEDTQLIEDQVAEMKRNEANKYAAQQASNTTKNDQAAPASSSSGGGGGWFGWMGGGGSKAEEPPVKATNNTPPASATSRWSADGGLNSDKGGSKATPSGAGAFQSGWSKGGGSTVTSTSDGGMSVGPGASDEELAKIMSKVKACAAYCPDEEKKKKMASYGQ